MKLYEYAQLIRSKNAGPFMLTIDIIFPTDDVYMKVWKSGALETDRVAKLLNSLLRPYFACCPAIALFAAFV